MYAGCLLPKGDGAKKLNAKNSDRMHVLHLDVTNDNHVSEAVQYVKKHSRNQGRYGSMSSTCNITYGSFGENKVPRYKLFFVLNSAEHEIVLLINLKLLTIAKLSC